MHHRTQDWTLTCQKSYATGLQRHCFGVSLKGADGSELSFGFVGDAPAGADDLSAEDFIERFGSELKDQASYYWSSQHPAPFYNRMMHLRWNADGTFSLV